MTLRLPLLLILTLLSVSARSQSYPLVPALTVPASFTANVRHTASLLTTTDKPPRDVRVLVYGQSISMQNWWQQVKQYLQLRYPNAQLVMENRAIGGFSSERLKLMVANDVIPFYPDLILFHDYGNEPDYEQIIRIIRSQTTADVIIQTDHIGIGQNAEWHDRHCDVWLPALCNKYGLALLDVRSAWKAYLVQHQLNPAKLLTDNVHLNEHGNFVMAQIIQRYLEALPARVEDPTTAIRVLRSGRDFSPRKDKLLLPVTGNRIDLVWNAPADSAQSVAVTVDGQRPSTQLASYYYTRPALKPTGFFLNRIGQLLVIKLGGKPQAEDWTLTVTAVDTVRQQLQFSVKGSLTGEDGQGNSEYAYVSTSGRIQIDSTGWFRRKSPGDFRQFGWLKPGDTLHWQVRSSGQDGAKPKNGVVTTVVQGIANAAHRLELTGKGVRTIREIRVYQPPLRP